MERRDARRISRRLACGFRVGDRTHRGFVLDISREGLYLQTDVIIDAGTEIGVALEGTRFPHCQLRAVVVRRLIVPGPLSGLVRRGVGLKLIDPPAEYLEALSEALQAGENVEDGSGEDDLAAGERIEIELALGEDGCDMPVPFVAGSTPPRAHSTVDARPSGVEIIYDDVARDDTPAPVSEDPAIDAEDVEEHDLVLSEQEWDGLDPVVDPDRRRSPGEDPTRHRPLTVDALVIDDGELRDVVDLLREIGADPVRFSGRDAKALDRLAVPPRIVVLSARTALNLPIERIGRPGDTATVVVAEGDSVQLLNRMRRQGFDHVVRRPVHPDALRLLLARLIYRGAERRLQTRVPIGGEVSLYTGFLRRRAMLLEVSSGGCSLLSNERPVRGARVLMRIPSAVTGGRALSLRGRVVRSQSRGEARDRWTTELGVAFEVLSERAAKRLDELMQDRLVGPVPMQRERRKAPRAPVEGSPGERRSHPRVAMRHEAVTLDSAYRADRVLYGTELSLGGMRIEPHPEVAVGDVLDLVVYSSWTTASASVRARVVREEAGTGLAIAFLEPDDTALEALAVILAGPSFLARLDERAEEDALRIADLSPDALDL